MSEIELTRAELVDRASSPIPLDAENEIENEAPRIQEIRDVIELAPRPEVREKLSLIKKIGIAIISACALAFLGIAAWFIAFRKTDDEVNQIDEQLAYHRRRLQNALG